MAKKFVSALAGIAFIGGATTLFAQDEAKQAKAGEGTLMVSGKNYPLKHALAYETTSNEEEVIAVVLSGQPVSSEKLKEAREAEKDGQDPNFKRPFVRLEFTKARALKFWSAGAGNTQLGRRSGNATGELKLQDSRVSGKASQPNETEGMFPAGFDVHFDVALLRAGESLPATVTKKPGPAANVKPSVTGVFKGNGKEAKLAHMSAHWREPFSNQPSMVLVFTEKDHSKDKKPDFDAGFGKFGSALIISLHEDGDIFGCEVVHTAHKKQGFSSIGQIKTNDFQFADGFSTRKGNMINETAAGDFRFEPLRKRVNTLGAYAVQTAGEFVSALTELSASMQVSQYQFDRRNLKLGMNVDRDSAAVISY